MTEILPDRPWSSREYGRVRLNEGLAGELMDILTSTIDGLHEDRILDKGLGRQVTDVNRRIRRVSQIRHMTHNMMHEKGWCACDGAEGTIPDDDEAEAEAGLRQDGDL